MNAYLIFIALHLILLLSSIGVNTVAVAFEDITNSLNTSLVTAGWVLSIYLLVYTISVVIMGKISEVFGRKQTFLGCSILFILGSLLAALAPNIQLLIIARVIQGLGGGGFVPVTLAILKDIFPKNRQKAVGISISVFNIGGIIGPGVGAWLVSSFGWRSVFWFNVPLGILSIIPVILLLKADLRQESKIDLSGAGLLAGSLIAIMIGLSQIKVENGLSGWLLVSALLIIGGIFVWLFIRHEFKAKDPIVDIVLLQRKPFLASNVYNIIFGACVFGSSSFLPLFATTVYGMSTVQSGWILSIRSVGNILAAMLASFLVMKWSYRRQLIIGTVLMSLTILLLGLEPRAFNLWGWYISDMLILSLVGFLSGLALGVGAPALINSLIDLMPEKTAAISGLGSMFRQSGGAISIALITVIVQSVGNNTVGFQISFVATGLLILACIPFVFAMPARAVATFSAEKSQ